MDPLGRVEARRAVGMQPQTGVVRKDVEGIVTPGPPVTIQYHQVTYDGEVCCAITYTSPSSILSMARVTKAEWRSKASALPGFDRLSTLAAMSITLRDYVIHRRRLPCEQQISPAKPRTFQKT